MAHCYKKQKQITARYLHNMPKKEAEHEKDAVYRRNEFYSIAED